MHNPAHLIELAMPHPRTANPCRPGPEAWAWSAGWTDRDHGKRHSPGRYYTPTQRLAYAQGYATWEIIREQLILDRTDAADGPPPSREPATDPAPS